MPLSRKPSPDGASTDWGDGHLTAALLIYLPRKNVRLSRPGWLTCSGRFTHISKWSPSAAGRAQERESSLVKDQRSITVEIDHITEFVTNDVYRCFGEKYWMCTVKTTALMSLWRTTTEWMMTVMTMMTLKRVFPTAQREMTSRRPTTSTNVINGSRWRHRRLVISTSAHHRRLHGDRASASELRRRLRALERRHHGRVAPQRQRPPTAQRASTSTSRRQRLYTRTEHSLGRLSHD